MDELISFQNNLVNHVPDKWHRYLYSRLKTNERLLGIKGLRGVGKTTLLLQYLAHGYPDKKSALYVTADHPYFYENSLFELASHWHKFDGKLLLVDEVHKYPNWSRELKLIFDGYPNMQVIFTSSSALDLYRGESDLSRRLITQELHGLSFREYLWLIHGIELPVLSLQEILENHGILTQDLVGKLKPIPHFKQYLQDGYFPFVAGVPQEGIIPRLIQVLNTVLENDLSYVEDYSPANVVKIKKLLGVIAQSAPFEPNISKIATRLQLSRNTVMLFLKNLHDAHILKLINRNSKGLSALQKPDKIYFENTSLTYALQPKAEIGTIRETFFINQLSNAGHLVNVATKGDFEIDSTYTVEIGGRNNEYKQVMGLENAFLAVDEIEHGFGNKIPLWLFGFLY